MYENGGANGESTNRAEMYEREGRERGQGGKMKATYEPIGM